MFGVFRILGYNFSPRFKDLDDQRFWRAPLPGVETGTCGPLEPLARNRVNLNKLVAHCSLVKLYVGKAVVGRRSVAWSSSSLTAPE